MSEYGWFAIGYVMANCFDMNQRMQYSNIKSANVSKSQNRVCLSCIHSVVKPEDKKGYETIFYFDCKM